MAHTGCRTPPFSPRALHSYGLEDCLTIVLTPEIGRGATGVVHRSTLEPEILDGVMPLEVVVKLAFDSEQRDALRGEYEVYRWKEFIKVSRRQVFCSRSHKAICQSLTGKVSSPRLVRCCLFQKSALKFIHRAGGDIRPANILIGDLGVTIMDFGHSKQCDYQGENWHGLRKH